MRNSWVNGGYYFFEVDLLTQLLDENPNMTLLEDHLLNALAERGELQMYAFEGDWQYLDGERHIPRLIDILGAASS